MNRVAIIQARMGSSRLPDKVLMDLGGRPALAWSIAAARCITGIDQIVVATGDDAGNDPIASWCAQNDVVVHRGSEDDVLARFAGAARAAEADIVMRLTADCPLLDPAVCGEVLMLLELGDAEYASNVDPASWPEGLDCEAFPAEALFFVDAQAQRPFEREHVTPGIRSRARRGRDRTANLSCPLPGLEQERWALDIAEDLQFLRALVPHLPQGRPPAYVETLRVLEAHPEIRVKQSGSQRNACYQGGITLDAAEPPRQYSVSMSSLARAEKVIPLGAQTFSKCRTQFPVGHAPLFLTHGDGGRAWDVDGNEYVDLVCGLLPVVLGYRDPDVDRAIREQLDRGISFSLPTSLEAELAERLVEIIPCAEAVRFGKNGTDATTAAVRLARAKTGRDRVAVCGYHGWQDWYVGVTSRNKGVPASVSDLTHVFPYNDIPALDALLRRHQDEFALVMLEPANVFEPDPGYLDELRDLVHRHGSLLAFDEIITGFRFALGGAQELFGATPDLATFGKAMANGMPLSAIVGRADVMREMEEIFFSATFGGEALSLAAAIAAIDKMRREPVIETLWRNGAALAEGATQRIAGHGLSDVISLSGKAPWMLLQFGDHPMARKEAIRTLFLRAMFDRGVLITASHNVCYAHSAADLSLVLHAYDGALAEVRRELDGGALESNLPCPVIEPVFAIR
jgi:glutamate-1-semialdehyde 2,1-aminomutase/spore coat polysaccharide biosynthesis protein SpsF